MKARPTVSYVLHTGKHAFSCAGRAGMFIMEQMDTILVTSMREVTTKFHSFNSMCSEKEYIYVFKNDIKDFFCNLPHALILSALEFFEDFTKNCLGRRRFVCLPDAFLKTQTVNYEFFKYEKWQQIKSYSPHFRRMLREKVTPRLSSTPCFIPGW